MISIVIPSYNEEGNIERTADVVSKLMEDNNIDYELVFVNDGSKDKTWEKISSVAEKKPHIVGVNFSRNFGKESAIFCQSQYIIIKNTSKLNFINTFLSSWFKNICNCWIFDNKFIINV